MHIFVLLIFVLSFELNMLIANASCDKTVIDVTTGQVVDMRTFCKDRPCINRYCVSPNTTMVRVNGTTMCLKAIEISKIVNRSIDFSETERVYRVSENNNKQLSAMNSRRDFKAISFLNETKNNCKAVWFYKKKENCFILEDGSLLMESPHLTRPAGSFIVEYFMVKRKNGVWAGPMLAVKVFADENTEVYRSHAFINSIGMIISSTFLIVLFIIYCMFRKLRNLAGLILMAYVSSFTVALLLRAAQILGLYYNIPFLEEACKYTSVVYYFTLMASFFWMNVFAFDIWWTFRGFIIARRTNRRGITHKFLMYCLYAFGMPLLMTIVASVIDTLPLTTMPNIKRPLFEHCMNSEHNTLLYVYVPMIILVSANIILFLMTSFNIWQVKRASETITNTSESATNKKHQNRFYLYIRLSLITGVHWILDFIDVALDEAIPSSLKYVINLYNVLIGIFIFAIFISRKKVLYLLRARLPLESQSDSFSRNKSRNSKSVTRTVNDKRYESIYMETINESNLENNKTAVQ